MSTPATPFRDQLDKGGTHRTPPQQRRNVKRVLIVLGVLVLLWAMGSSLGGDEEAGARADQATQAELQAWADEVHQEALDSYGVSSWDELCQMHLEVMVSEGDPAVTGWPCLEPQFSATTIGVLDVRLETADADMAQDVATKLMSIVGASREDLQEVTVREPGGGLLGYELRSGVPALN